MSVFVDSLLDSILDCLKVVPVLFLAYLLVSYLSHDHSHKFSKFLSKNKKTSVFYASLLGCVPQCGFSSVMADLYSEKHISLGTLVAVFVATSDEAVPLMLTNTNSIPSMLLMIGVKILLAIIWGYLIDFVISLWSKRAQKSKDFSSKQNQNIQNENCETKNQEILLQNADTKKSEDACGEISSTDNGGEHHHETFEHHHGCGHIHSDECGEDCGHEHGCCVDNVFLDAFLHTFEISIYIFVATFVINLIVGYAGTDALSNALSTNMYLQIVLAALIGLIPNCASSVLLVELYLYGTLAFPALIAGLTSGAGVGLVILWTKNKNHPLQNLGITFLLYALGVVSGLILSPFFA